MKRSEMIDIISDYLAIDGVIVKSDMYIYDIAREILGLIEARGMLPPAEYHEQDREAKVNCNGAERWMKWDERGES